MMTAQTKICTRCKLPKPLDEFHRNRARPDGHSFWCKICTTPFRVCQWCHIKKSTGEFNSKISWDGRVGRSRVCALCEAAGTRACTKCKASKRLEEFYLGTGTCKACHSTSPKPHQTIENRGIKGIDFDQIDGDLLLAELEEDRSSPLELSQKYRVRIEVIREILEAAQRRRAQPFDRSAEPGDSCQRYFSDDTELRECGASPAFRALVTDPQGGGSTVMRLCAACVEAEFVAEWPVKQL
jgi:hypothetical protein